MMRRTGVRKCMYQHIFSNPCPYHHFRSYPSSSTTPARFSVTTYNHLNSMDASSYSVTESPYWTPFRRLDNNGCCAKHPLFSAACYVEPHSSCTKPQSYVEPQIYVELFPPTLFQVFILILRTFSTIETKYFHKPRIPNLTTPPL